MSDSPDLESWQQAATDAVDAIAARLGPRGQWPGWAYADADPAATGRLDIAAPLTALGMLALAELPLAGVPEVLAASRRHLELTVLAEGLWRYYANIPPDTDDSAMCALALGPDHPAVVGRTAQALTGTRLPNGLYPTWFTPGLNPVIDPVPNAHVVAVLGPGPATDDAVAWLIEVVAAGTEVADSVYYLDALDLHIALTRAVAAGVEALRPALAAASARAHARLLADGLSPYRTAQAIIVASHAEEADAVLLADAADHLLASRHATGLWPSDTLFVAGNTDAPGWWHYQSDAVTSALCARALVLASGAAGANGPGWQSATS